MRILLFVFLFSSLVFARGWHSYERTPVYPVPKDTLTDEQLAELPPMDWSIDSTDIYHQLVLNEIPNARYDQNIFGIVIGGALTAAGLYCVGSVIYLENNGSVGWDAVFDGIVEGVLLTASVPLLLVGGPLLGYNIYYLNEHRAHARQRDEYLKAENAYKRRRAAGNPDAVSISIVPTIDFAHAGGGMNLMVAF